MDILIVIGTAVTLLGLAGIILSLVRVIRLRREGLEDAALRARMATIMPLNLGAFLLSVLGLMLVVLGIVLG